VITFEKILEATGGICSRAAGNGSASGISIDTRTIRAGELYVAIKGPNYKGSRFCEEAFKKGASAVMVQRGGMPISHVLGRVFMVEDTVRALGDLAASVRGSFKTPLVAVAGSCGKTTTKEMIAAILSRDRSVLKTEGNKNNLIGLPLTLLGLNGAVAAAVVELGISEPGEMERLVEIAAPDVALITNIGSAHLENFESIDAIGAEKGLLYELAGLSCVKVVNIDDPLAVKASDLQELRRSGREVVTFSKERVADVRVVEVREGGAIEGALVTLDVRGQVFDVRLGVPGAFNVANALAAIAAALPFGVYLDDIIGGLEAFKGLGGRMEVTVTGLVTLIDDTYNANPDSMGAALRSLSNVAGAGRRVAVIGEMHELGGGAEEAHREVGRLCAELGLGIIVAVGGRANDVAAGALEGGMSEKRIFAFEDKCEALAALRAFILREGDAVLVKASRAAGLEYIAEGLKSQRDASCEALG